VLEHRRAVAGHDVAMATTTPGVGPPGTGDDPGPGGPEDAPGPLSVAGSARDLAAAPGGGLRPAWDRVLRPLLALGPDELARRQRAADRLMVAEGASAVLHDDAATVRPWRIDIAPLVVDAVDWAPLERGLAARAALLAEVVADLRGPRRLLREGVVPVEALAGHAGPLASSWGTPPAVRLTVVGADVVIDAGGRARVVADVTDVPSGDGHALLARSVSARVLPPAHPSLGLVGHRGYTAALRATLATAAPPTRSSPRIVVVTGSPDDPGYVEDSYLATQLGYDLAERADVAVGDGRVWLRSLEGLEPVEVLLRRVPEAAFDPVEDARFRGAGIAGVVGAAREGRVAIVNPYGVGVASSFALLPFLDDAARFLTGEPLALPSVTTLWCGDPDHRRAVRADPTRYVLHDTDATRPAPPAVAAELSDAGLAGWLDRLTTRPERYVAQEVVDAATAPRLVDGRVAAGAVSLRTQVVLAPSGPAVLPGGHARLLDGRRPLAGRHGGTGKDVWVLDPARREQGRARAVALAIPQVDLRRSLPTRSAEAMYWTGRMAERAEMAARAAHVALTRVTGAAPEPADIDAAARALRSVSGGMGGAPVDSHGPGASAALDVEVRSALTGRPGAVVPSLRSTVFNARTARSLLSARTWRLLTMLDTEADALDLVARTPTEPSRGEGGPASVLPADVAAFDVTEALDRVLVPLAALAGLTNETVVRGPGWRFFDIGRRIERALLVLGLIEALFEPAPDDATLLQRGEIALACNESLVAYRRRHRTDVTLEALGDLLLTDRDNPRSVRFQLEQVSLDLHDLPERSVRRVQLAAVRSAQHRLDSRVPLGSGRGHDGLGPVGALVVAVRQPILEVGDLVPRGWFTERPRRVR